MNESLVSEVKNHVCEYCVYVNRQSMSEQHVILQRQEKEQQDKVKLSVPDKKKLSELEKNVAHLKKGKLL